MKAAKRFVGRLAKYAQIFASSDRNEDPENLRKLVLGESKDDMVIVKDCQAAETFCNTKQGCQLSDVNVTLSSADSCGQSLAH